MTGQEKGDLNRGDHMDRFDYCQVRKYMVLLQSVLHALLHKRNNFIYC